MPSNPQTLPACRTPACTTLQRAPCLGPALARRPPCSPWDALWCFITAVPDPPMDLLRCASLLTAAATAAASHTLRHAQLRLQQPSPRGTSGLLHTLYVHRTYGADHMAIRAMCDMCVCTVTCQPTTGPSAICTRSLFLHCVRLTDTLPHMWRRPDWRAWQTPRMFGRI